MNVKNVDFDAMFSVRPRSEARREVDLNDDFDLEPLAENSYATYGNFALVGHGKVTNDYCGKFWTYKGCLRVELHNRITLDGKDYRGKVFVRKARHFCNKASCPKCFKSGWAVREAGNIKARLVKASKRFGKVEHIVASVPARDYGLSFEALRRKVITVLKSRGVLGGVLIFHGFRYDLQRQWYWSPHFHVLGFIKGGYGRCRQCARKWNCLWGCGGFDDRAYQMFWMMAITLKY